MAAAKKKKLDAEPTFEVVLSRNSRGAKAGDVVEVDPETAERLVGNGHARYPDSQVDVAESDS